jgi:hypothetical protein
MAGYRSQVLRSKVQKKTDKFDDYVYEALNGVQLEICERATCLESKFEISVVSGTELYDFPDGFIVERVLEYPGIVKANIEKITEIKSGNNSTSSDIAYYYTFGNQIGFMLADGSAPNVTETINVYGWRRPKEDGTEKISETIDPIVNNRWDYCLELGAITRLIDDPKLISFYGGLYEQEFRKQNVIENSIDDNLWSVPYNGDYNG